MKNNTKESDNEGVWITVSGEASERSTEKDNLLHKNPFLKTEKESKDACEQNGEQEKQNARLQDFLHAIIKPPSENRSHTDSILSLSITHRNRPQLQELTHEYEDFCKTYQTKQTGIDHTRTHLTFQLFDELIRECAIDCSERGLMMVRVRDEAKMTLDAYQMLFSLNKGTFTTKSDHSLRSLAEQNQRLLNATEKKRALQSQILHYKNLMANTEKTMEMLRNSHKQTLLNHEKSLRVLIFYFLDITVLFSQKKTKTKTKKAEEQLQALLEAVKVQGGSLLRKKTAHNASRGTSGSTRTRKHATRTSIFNGVYTSSN
ncbi:hypothetical protein RFI_11611 [Reticulomyxa filosa]|uniref:Uncharacterized protein n=1 Tax=Reticulomyxa filosa TaxID=46433 RepID=X6NGT6_RETFI|nr:hypothetical protein RFI_11611 [Reticulomyxa filosa]|eukprot:ETO25530.1 hypothetical protein RFI_11611 [Reticulomyxa filosa]